MRLKTIVIASLLSVTGCSSGEDMAKASASIEQFQNQLDAGDFAAIYAHASPEAKKVQSEKEYAAFLAVVHRKLGKVKATKQVGWKVNFGTSGTVTTITMETEFERGKGREQFTYKANGEASELVGYNVNSQALIMN